MEYQKRPGTSGIEGEYYETKLLALLALRLRKDKRVTDFWLATNMDEMGAYDDICLRVNIVGHKRPVALFIQQKHREKDGTFLSINENKTDLIKYINSFTKIKTKMSSPKNDFCKDLRIEDSIFILYTNAEFKVTNSVLKSDDSYTTFNNVQNILINDLLVTSGTGGRQLRCSDELEENFAKTKLEGDLMSLAEHFATYLCDEAKQVHIMDDEYVQQYHVILTRHVVDVSDIQTDKTDTKFRTLTFRNEFFESQQIDIMLFRQTLFQQILKKHPKIESRSPARPAHDSSVTEAPVDDLIASFLLHKSAVTLSPLIATHIASNEYGTLEFLIDRPHSDVEQLRQISISREIIAEAYLRSLKLNVPAGFGNIDMVMGGGPKKIEKRLNHLVTEILDLCQRYKQVDSFKVVTIDDTVDGGLLNHNGGLASGVGNILTCDENTTMLRFTNNFTPMQSNAKALYEKLKERTKLPNNEIFIMHEYRFNIKTNKFPKLHLDCTNIAREFISKLVIYDKQSNQSEVEELLKDEIQKLLEKETHHSTLNCHSVFLHYHDEIVNWWMRKKGKCLDKTNNLYELAINNILVEPQISALRTTFQMSNSKYYGYSFNENTSKWLELAEHRSETFIVTDTVTLTSMKVIQCLRNLYAINKYTVFDLECVANLSTTDFCSLGAELRKTEKVLIIVWHNTDNSKISETTLYELAQATKDKQIVIITNDALMEKIKEYFSCIEVFRDETQDFTSMTPESQKDVRENCKVTFQGQAVSLDLVVDDVSLSFIKGVVLDKITRNESIDIGARLDNSRYKEMKDWYIDRTVRDVDEEYKMTIKDLIYNNYVRYPVSKFEDIANDVVLLTAPSGMGKSTLLTHLSLNTKECDMNLWIVRVNFIDHSNQFLKWKNDDTRVDALEALNFLCQVVFSDKIVSFSVALTNDEASLVNCAGDALITFQLNIFLRHYNRGKLTFVFDGFDEICPDYKQKVIEFLIAVKTHLKKSKMWVASRPYSDILPDLQRVLGRGFKMEPLSYQEQKSYLKKFWQEKSLNEKLSKQSKQLEAFIENAEQSISEAHVCIQFTYYNFVVAVRPVWCRSQTYNKEIDERLERFRRASVGDALSGFPLILYFIADYFVNVVDNKRIESKLIINLHNIYEMFIENKINKMIPNGNKNLNMSAPAVKSMCKKEHVSLLNVYKKLAANDIFRYSMFRLEEFEDMKPLNNEELNFELSEIKTGADNTGLISHVTADNVPVFIHRSFTEYFAAEYVCDILKSREFNKSKKILWNCYLIFYQHKGVRDWIKTKKKVDKTLQDVFKEIEEPLPIYATEFGNYLTKDNLSERQYIRMLASCVDDYENGYFSLFSDGFTLNDWSAIDEVAQQDVIEILKNYNISKMKAHLKKHFVGSPAIFELRNTTLTRDFSLAELTISYGYTYNYHIAIEVVGQKRSVPLLMRLEHEDNDDTLYIKINLKCDSSYFESNNKIISRKDCDKFGGADIDETELLYILHDYGKIQEVLNTKHFPSYGALKKMLATTNIVRCRPHHSEQNIEELTNILFKNELSLLAYQLLSIIDQDVDKTFPLMKHFDQIKQYRYRAIFKEKVVEIEEGNLKYPDWRIWMFRDDFLDTDDKHVFRNCLLEGILYKSPIHLIEELKPDDLISSFLSEPSTATLTPLIGAYIVCCEEGELQFVIERPPDDIERLRQINIQQSAIDVALVAVRTAAIEYLRSLQLKVPVDFVDGYVDVGRSSFISYVTYAVDAIVRLCEQYNQTALYKVVTIADIQFYETFGHDILISGVCSILTYDEQSGMLKFSNEHQFTATQKNAKQIFLELSDKIENIHEYRFHVKYNKFSEVYVDCTNTAREFLNNLVIYTEQGSHYEEKIFVNLKSVCRDAVAYSKIKSQLSLLHYHSETIKWWTTPNTGASLTKTFQHYTKSRGTDTCLIKTRDLYRQASYNMRAEPLISKLHTKFHMNHSRYFGYSFSKRNSKWKEILEIPCRTIIVTDTVIPTTVEVMQILRNDDSSDNYRVLDLDDVFNVRIPLGLHYLENHIAELRQTDKFLIIVWHTPQPSDSEILRELVEAIKEKQLVVVTNNESSVNVQEYFLSTNRVFKCETEPLSIKKNAWVNRLVFVPVLIFAFLCTFIFITFNHFYQ